MRPPLGSVLNQTLLILTAGFWQVPVICKAKAMGLRVVVTDQNPSAPALRYADFAEVVSARDRDAVLAVARRHRVNGVIAEGTDVAVGVAAFVAERMGLPGITLDTAAAATNKFEMRERCRIAGIPTPKYRRVSSAAEAADAAEEIGLPVVVKPLDGQSSRGVAKLDGAAEVRAWFPRASAVSSDGTVMVEEMMLGTESSAEGFVADGKTFVFGICEKFKCPPPYSFDLRLVYPAAFPAAVIDEIVALNERVVRAVGIDMGITHAEYIVTAGGPRLLEIAARGCGSWVATKLIPAMTGVDLIGARIRQALGLDVQIVPTRSLAGLLEFLMLPLGTIRSLDGVDEARAVPGVVDAGFFVKAGDRITRPENGTQRPGFLLAVGDDREALMRVSHEARARIRYEMLP